MRRDEQFDLGRTEFERNWGYNAEFLRRARENQRRRQEEAGQRQARRDAELRRRGIINRSRAVPGLVAPLWVRGIVANMAEKHGIEPSDILVKRRRRHYVACRHEIMHALRTNEREPSLTLIARWLGLDHTTVLHGYRKHIERMAQETANGH